MSSLQTIDFDYALDESLIAMHPLKERSQSRLMHVNAHGQRQDMHFYDLLQLIQPNDLLVFNTTKVIKARLFGQKVSGGKVECFIERIISSHRAYAHIKASKSPKNGSVIIFKNQQATVIERDNDLFLLELHHMNWHDLLESQGHVPLPPYIKREAQLSDQTRYQTIYGQTPGAVAAPTAGLHFDKQLLQAIENKGILSAEVLLHVGAGTFQPVRSEQIEQHHMHKEYIEVSQACVDKIQHCHEKGGRVIAVGTTVVRALESAGALGSIQPFTGDTDIFIYPGKPFHVVDALITNFHLPKSSLLMLVSAFSGMEAIRQAYADAIEKKYRFFSYGDAMFLEKQLNAQGGSHES